MTEVNSTAIKQDATRTAYAASQPQARHTQAAAYHRCMRVSPRQLVPEVMDDPALPRDQHVAALRGLTRLNAVSGSARTLWPWVRAAANRGGPVRLVDVACGGGDVALSLLRRAARANIDLHVTGVDVSPVALDVASAAAQSAGLEHCTDWQCIDALHEALPPADVVMSNLFMHHLDSHQATGVLAAMRACAAQPGAQVLINDLCRSRITQGLVTLGSHALSRSAVVHVDGPRSARAAWTVRELRDLAQQAQLDQARVKRVWPCRMLLRWSRP